MLHVPLPAIVIDDYVIKKTVAYMMRVGNFVHDLMKCCWDHKQTERFETIWCNPV